MARAAGRCPSLLLAITIALVVGGTLGDADPNQEEMVQVWPLASAAGAGLLEVPANLSQVTLAVLLETPLSNPKWLDPNMFPVVDGINSTFEVKTSSSLSSLVIRHVQVNMSGTYTLADDLHTTTTNVTINVLGIPHVHITNKKPGQRLKYLEAKQEHQLVCIAQGFPTPNITWFFSDCNEEDIRNCKLNLKQLPADKVTEAKVLDGDRGIVQSTARYWADSWGDLVCKACNEYGCSTDDISVVSTDLPGDEGFIVEGPAAVPVGRTVELTCAVSKVGWILKSEWLFSKDGEAPRPVKEVLPDVIELPWITKYSLFSKIAFPRAAPRHAGNYTCIQHKLYWNHVQSHVLAVTQDWTGLVNIQ